MWNKILRWKFQSFVSLNLFHENVLQAERKTDSVLAAAKIIDVKDESELDDFMVEIDILSECKHKHVVGMYEAYYHENKLWVSS